MYSVAQESQHQTLTDTQRREQEVYRSDNLNRMALQSIWLLKLSLRYRLGHFLTRDGLPRPRA